MQQRLLHAHAYRLSPHSSALLFCALQESRDFHSKARPRATLQPLWVLHTLQRAQYRELVAHTPLQLRVQAFAAAVHSLCSSKTLSVLPPCST